MEELKVVLENLNSALFELQGKIAKANELQEKLNIKAMKQDEVETAQAQKAQDLNAREAAVKNIESVVEYSKQAKALMQEARALMDNANIRQAEIENGYKKLAKDKAAAEAKNANEDELNKKQMEALQKERKKLNEEIKEFEVKKRVEKELAK